jgi:putative transposase
LDASGCIECLEQTVRKYGKPKIINSDQGSQFTSQVWVSMLNELEITISMDGKGRWVDNVYVERFWRSLKRECIYINGIESVAQLHIEVAKYITYYNTYRLHSSLGYNTPYSVYTESLNMLQQCLSYCNWPPDNERIMVSKKMVLPTILAKEVA